MEAVRVLALAFGKSLYWSLLVALFGLLQLWLVFAYEGLTAQPLGIERVMRDGVLLFFAVAVTIGLTLDFWFEAASDAQPTPMGLWIVTAFVFYPLMILTLVVALAMALAINGAQLETSALTLITLTVTGMTTCYALMTKTYLFLRVLRAQPRYPTFLI
ncbi:hypothetical protein [Halochromatium salexigens]|uniref:Uncharacterized protein n=1 Tax=Halochromatium salexigens TaxID=49447 RepID=A0AAJ0XGN8_HALSE|nr:hypothetical protein [Halochromatium salexigens]MBK5931291.1 hypothetical protein [Halochromatium salexigens]